MIKTLRKRVIALTMLAVFIVLIVLMGIVNLVNYINIDNSMDVLLDVLEENGGTFAMFGKNGGKFDDPDFQQGQQGNQAGQDMQGQQGQQGNQVGQDMQSQQGQQDVQAGQDMQGQQFQGPQGKKDDSDGLRPGMSKETPFETRFFSVILNNETEEMIRIDTSRIAAVTQEQAVELAKKIAASSSSSASSSGKSGYISNGNLKYKYRIVPNPVTPQVNPALTNQSSEGAANAAGDSAAHEAASGDATMYIFVDATRQLDAGRDFLMTSILVSLGGLVAIGILVVLLSPMMVRPMAESYEKQKRFITNASHELKTPLAVIKSCNEVVEMESGESKWTSSIGEQVDRMSALIGQMVSLSKMDEAAELSGDLPKDEVILSDLLEDALEPFSLLASQKGLALTCQTDATPTKITGNAGSLTELINILADNAIKYCSPGGSIDFKLTRQGNKVILTEENPSEGLEPGDQRQLFDRFFRGDQSHTKDEEIGGYGIGLSLAQAIVLAHGGKISAESPDGKILRFTITL